MANTTKLALVFALLFWATAAGAAEVALVTSASEGIKLEEEKGVTELRPFIKLREGDRLVLNPASRLQLVFFAGGRQETWQGKGAIQVGTGAATSLMGGLQPEVKTLPAILVKQLTKTPSPDGKVKAGMVRMRAIGVGPSLDSVEKTYADLRRQAVVGDRSPELYLLASYLELREFERLETLLARMVQQAPHDPELKVLSSLYGRAINNAKMASKQ